VRKKRNKAGNEGENVVQPHKLTKTTKRRTATNKEDGRQTDMKKKAGGKGAGGLVRRSSLVRKSKQIKRLNCIAGQELSNKKRI